MISYYLEVIILSVIQGVTEFIPVSSSAHLIIISNISDFNLNSLEVDVSLHLGSLLAIVVYFWRDLIDFSKNKKKLYLIFFGSIPLIIVGYVLYISNLINHLRNLELIAWTTLIFGVLLYFSDKNKTDKILEKDLSKKDIIFIGMLQILSLIPGVSRSGINITAGRFVKYSRIDSAKISFFLSIPALAGASLLGLNDILKDPFEFNSIIFLTISISFIFSYLTIKFLLYYLDKFSLKIFVFYRIILAFFLFAVIYF
jgi:undecaprenyl-diphosphatase